MLIDREELRYRFSDRARFDVARPFDRGLLAWIFNQFLYGEVTGIQCGHWLFHAPHLSAASFLAKQAGEELAHVRKILRIFSVLGEKPGPAHPAIRFLSTGMMGGDWGEHVALEMALGEGLVLTVFYAMADTIPQPEIKRLLESALGEEERHVEFGERETAEWLRQHPRDRRRLLALALVQLWALRWLKRFVVRGLRRGEGKDHPVLLEFESFFDHVLWGFGRRIELLGLSDRPLKDLSVLARARLIAGLPPRWLFSKLKGFLPGTGPRLLTSTYLADPSLTSEEERFARG